MYNFNMNPYKCTIKDDETKDNIYNVFWEYFEQFQWRRTRVEQELKNRLFPHDQLLFVIQIY